jgi:peptidoglycan/LPS O-acetylase OafA/YrhL
VTAIEGLVIALVMTELSWRYVERPFLRLKSRLAAPMINAAAEAAAA